MASQKQLEQELADNLTTKLNRKMFKEVTHIILEEVKSLIVSHLELGHEVNLVGFGKFIPFVRHERLVRNPATKEMMSVGKVTVAKFRVAEKLKETLKN